MNERWREEEEVAEGGVCIGEGHLWYKGRNLQLRCEDMSARVVKEHGAGGTKGGASRVATGASLVSEVLRRHCCFDGPPLLHLCPSPPLQHNPCMHFQARGATKTPFSRLFQMRQVTMPRPMPVVGHGQALATKNNALSRNVCAFQLVTLLITHNLYALVLPNAHTPLYHPIHTHTIPTHPCPSTATPSGRFRRRHGALALATHHKSILLSCHAAPFPSKPWWDEVEPPAENLVQPGAYPVEGQLMLGAPAAFMRSYSYPAALPVDFRALAVMPPVSDLKPMPPLEKQQQLQQRPQVRTCMPLTDNHLDMEGIVLHLLAAPVAEDAQALALGGDEAMVADLFGLVIYEPSAPNVGDMDWWKLGRGIVIVWVFAFFFLKLAEWSKALLKHDADKITACSQLVFVGVMARDAWGMLVPYSGHVIVKAVILIVLMVTWALETCYVVGLCCERQEDRILELI